MQPFSSVKVALQSILLTKYDLHLMYNFVNSIILFTYLMQLLDNALKQKKEQNNERQFDDTKTFYR